MVCESTDEGCQLWKTIDRAGETGDAPPLHQNIRFTRPLRGSRGPARAELAAVRARMKWTLYCILNRLILCFGRRKKGIFRAA